MTIAQLIIAITGPLGFWLTLGRGKPHKRLGLAIILAGQPFWLWESYGAGQWGIFAVSALWTCAWGRALWEEWRR